MVWFGLMRGAGARPIAKSPKIFSQMRLTTTTGARAGAPCAAAAGTRRPIGIAGRQQRVAARRGRASQTNRASPAVLRAVGEEEDLGVLASTDFDAEKVDVLESMFDDADVKGTGKLGPTEIRTLLECAGSFCYALHVMTEDETLDIIRKYDRDGDERLDFDEFIKFAEDKLLVEAHLKSYEAAFKRLDKKGTGKLGVIELRELFGTLATEGSGLKAISDKKLNHLVIKYAQTDSTGLTFEEFLIMARNVLPEVADIMKYLKMGEEEDAVAAKTKKGRGGGMFGALRGMLEETLSSNVEVVERKTFKRGIVNEVRSMEDFQLLLQEESGPIVLEVGFTFCKPCKRFEPKYKLFAEHYDKVLFLKVYGNRNQSCKQLCKQILQVKATPSFYMYKEGSLASKHVGIKEDGLRKKIKELLN